MPTIVFFNQFILSMFSESRGNFFFGGFAKTGNTSALLQMDRRLQFNSGFKSDDENMAKV